ncbi:hypothetical protein CI109_105755 [Kwoniella shandongensis]|uniref:Uncharacterized protein n=1 Tax=Kwoniella shandongensis TaxID=1734106 RepID=A0A5M6C0M9_9TREE|nr:uncharacterized protein CI109_003095 [Kwoniella shandongensis]KAA5528563.1 hypothetical protein CI109_003095 [Kwoniella shandongensis]
MSLISVFTSLLRICCGSSQEPSGPTQQQHQQQQQHSGYPGAGVGQQQTAYPPQGQPSWANVAGQGGQHYQPQQQQQQHYPPQQQHQQGGGAWQSHPSQPQHQQYQQNGHAPSKPYHLPAGGILGPHHPGYQDDNQINQANAKYMDLRNQARRAGDEAHRCFAESQQAYQSGDGARAHELSVEGKQHQAKQDQLDDQASAWIFDANNEDSPADTIDLHGLYVKEAIERTETAISQGQRRGQGTLKVIVGKGIHSQGGVAKIKPAVEGLMRKYNLTAHVDPDNAGVLIVDLTGQHQGGTRSRDAGGLVDDLGKQDEGCTIM